MRTLLSIILIAGIFLNTGCASTSRNIDSVQRKNITIKKHTKVPELREIEKGIVFDQSIDPDRQWHYATVNNMGEVQDKFSIIQLAKMLREKKSALYIFSNEGEPKKNSLIFMMNSIEDLGRSNFIEWRNDSFTVMVGDYVSKANGFDYFLSGFFGTTPQKGPKNLSYAWEKPYNCLRLIKVFNKKKIGSILPEEIINSLRSLDEKEAAEYLVGVLNDSDTQEKTRQIAAITLAPYIQEYPQIKEPLKNMLKSQDVQLKKDIILGLGQTKGKIAFDMIKPFVQDEDPLLRQASVLSLAYSDIPEAIDIIELLTSDPVSEVRQVTALSLGIRQDIKAIEPLKKLTTDKIPEVRAIALESLAYIPVETGSRLRQDFGGQAKQLRVAEIQPFLDDPSPVVRVTAVEILVPEVADFPELETKFIKLAEFDDDIMVKSVATLGLGNINKPEVVDIIKTNLNSSDWRLRQAATLASGKIELPETTKLLTRSLVDSNSFVRNSAVIGLGYKIEKHPTIKNEIKSILNKTNLTDKTNYSAKIPITQDQIKQWDHMWDTDAYRNHPIYMSYYKDMAIIESFDVGQAAREMKKAANYAFIGAACHGLSDIKKRMKPFRWRSTGYDIGINAGKLILDTQSLSSESSIAERSNALLGMGGVGTSSYLGLGKAGPEILLGACLGGYSIALKELDNAFKDLNRFDNEVNENYTFQPVVDKSYMEFDQHNFSVSTAQSIYMPQVTTSKEIKIDIPKIQTYEPIKIDDSWRK